MEIPIQLLSFKSEQPSFDADPSGLESLDANTARKRMGITRRNHNASKPRFN